MFAKNGVSEGSVFVDLNSYHLKLHRIAYNVFHVVFRVHTRKGVLILYLPLQTKACWRDFGVCVSEILSTRLCMMVSFFRFGRR